MSEKHKDDMIRTEEAVGWIEWLRNPMNTSMFGADLIDKMTDDAIRAVKEAAAEGMIKRSDAIRAVGESIPERPYEGLDSWRAGKWNTLRAMYVEVMWYAEGGEE